MEAPTDARSADIEARLWRVDWLTTAVDWDERQRFYASEPDAQGLKNMVRVLLGESVDVVEVRRLVGGLDAATHGVRTDRGDQLVVKRTMTSQVAALQGEYARLEFAQRALVPTPAPIGLDASGSWFGHPALVMSMLPGRNAVHVSVGDWIESLADTLAKVHSTPLGAETPAVLQAPHAGMVWEPAPPTELPSTARVEALGRAGVSLRNSPHNPPQVFLHHDFHQRNVLWNGPHVAGVLDWNEARIGPAACDVAYCSVDIAVTHGVEASQRFTSAYQRFRPGIVDLARWQCLWTVNAMRWIKYWIAGFHAAGFELSLTTAEHRLDQLADIVLDQRDTQ